MTKMTDPTFSTDPVSEDTIQCWIFSSLPGPEISSWENFCKQINDSIKIISDGYIWHKDEFQVFCPIFREVRDTDVPMHLCGTTTFGDNIEDEWYIVYLLFEISKQYQDVVIQVKDNDGDFLLIEAADYLESWANPQSTENRVFIYNNHLHLISPEVAKLTSKLTLKTALSLVCQMPNHTQANVNIEKAIFNRICKYPDKILENIHKTPVELPPHLATLLIIKPSLIAPIVDAYCNHDIIDAKCCKNIDFNGSVTIEVKFTRFLYAKLIHSKIINSVKQNHLPNYIKKITGLKLTCGLQIITNRASVTDLFSTTEYFRFLERLKKIGYFRDNIEGSKEYNNMLDKAKDYFSSIECPVTSYIAHNIKQITSSNDYDRIKSILNDKYAVTEDYTGDNDDWLNIHPEELNNMLSNHYGKKTKLNNDDIISAETITNEISSFLKQTSDFEGIETSEHVRIEENGIEFEPDQFKACLEKMLGMLSVSNDHEITDSDDNDMDDDVDVFLNECDDELKVKLQQDHASNDVNDSHSIFTNIKKSMQEEKASSGPSSNLLRSMGIKKSEIIDSDDE